MNEFVDKVSLAYWFPKLQASGVLTPTTKIITTKTDFGPMMDGQPSKEIDEFIAFLKHEAEHFGFPLFLRTGHLSAKHSWKDSCFVPSKEQIGNSIYALVEASALATLRGLPMDVWVIRSFLDLDIRFTAFHGDMPVAVERRYFIEDGKVICSHPYWPAGAFEQIRNKPENWGALLTEMNAVTAPELEDLSVQVSQSFEGAWSLDWAKHKSGTWYAIDMAPMEVSWHWPGCEHGETHAQV
jgi:hypothetical protein